METISILLCMLLQFVSYTTAENTLKEQFYPFRGLPEGYPGGGGDDCPFTECCKEKAMSVVSECYTMGPLLSALLSLALFIKLTASSAATVCTTTTLEMSTTTGTIEKFVTVTSTSTTVSTTLQVFPVTSVLLATAVLARTIEVLETAPLVYTTITVTSEVITTRTVSTIQIDEGRCRYKNAKRKRELEEFGSVLPEAEMSGLVTYRNQTIEPSKQLIQPGYTTLRKLEEDSWFSDLDDSSGHSIQPVATRTSSLSSRINDLQPSFRF